MEYLTLDSCRAQLFPYIRARMASAEPAPYYEGERSGTEKLGASFQFMQRDEYKGILGKASYVFCSIIDGHHFSNGNKRLAVTVLIYFLILNGYKIHAPNMEIMRNELHRVFPKLQWEEIVSFRNPHEYFFYHLALIIADRKQKGQMTFAQEQHAVKELLEVVIVKP